jgi:hypothetical protein
MGQNSKKSKLKKVLGGIGFGNFVLEFGLTMGSQALGNLISGSPERF